MDTECQTSPSPRSRAGLDWFNFFMADIRTGVGPFIAIHLMNHGWTLAQIGMALTAAELAGVLSQAPGGALMDHAQGKRFLLAAAVLILAASALAMALFPNLAVVLTAQVLLGITGSIFGPGVSAVTLGLVTYACLGARTGRNASFGSAGNVVAAVTMGLIGYRYSTTAIFYFVAILCLPTLAALAAINPKEIDYHRARGGASEDQRTSHLAGLRDLFKDRRVRAFIALTVLWHLGNGAMLAMVGERIAKDRAQQSALWMSAAVTVPQLVMMLIAPVVGKNADTHGRKPILLFGFLFLPLRAALCAFTAAPSLLIAYQLLDGISAGIFGIVGVLMIADLTRGTGHYNLALGTVSAAVGIGASISTAVAGVITDHWGFSAGFLGLALSGVAATLVLWLAMPETHPTKLPAEPLPPQLPHIA